MSPAPDRAGPRRLPGADNPFLLRGYAPLAGLIVFVFLLVTLVPSRSPRQSSSGLTASGRPGGGITTASGPTAEGVEGGVEAGGGAAGGAAGTPGAPGETAGGGGGGATAAVAPAPGTRGATVKVGTSCAGGDRQDPNSAYSPPCIEFSGDNGGATSKGVTATEIIVAFRVLESGGLEQAGAVLAGGGINDSEEDIDRTADAYIEYFNNTYQFYGRKIRLVRYNGKGDALAETLGGGQEAANADALVVGQEINAFADLTALTPPYADGLVGQEVVAIGPVHLSREWYTARRPYAWGTLVDCTTLVESESSYVINRMANKNAVWAGNPAMRTKPRTFGVIVPENPWYQECANHNESLLNAGGVKLTHRINYPLDFNAMSQLAANAVTQFKAAGVSTVICTCDPILPVFMTTQANQQDYHPEWLVTGTALTDADYLGQLYDQQQWAHAFGISFLGDILTGYDSESYRAYKLVRDDEPAATRDLFYAPLMQMALCLQMAGPNLTPETFEEGCFNYPQQRGEFGLWNFGPGDYTATSDAREVFYDPTAESPFNHEPGRYITTLGGQRFFTEWPVGDPEFPAPRD